MKNFLLQKRIIILIVFILALVVSPRIKVKAAIANTINFQTKIVVKATGLNVTSGTPPACVVSGTDTCDFRVRIWNLASGGTATAGNNLLYEELFNNIELGDTNGIFTLVINSVCGATSSTNHSWGSTVASTTVCNLLDDNGDSDSTTGVNFDRSDLYLEVTFDPSGAWTDLASPPGGIETFTRTNLNSVPSAFMTSLVGGLDENGYVQLSPSGVQNTTSSTAAIRINQTGVGDGLKLDRNISTQNALRLDNSGRLVVGSTNGLILLGGDTNIYRSTSTLLKTDDNFIMDGASSTQLTVQGLSNFKGNLRAIATVANGSTTTTGTGTLSKVLTVTSTTNFDVGNLLLINGTTYAIIESKDPASTTAITVNPPLTWTAGQTVVEYTVPKLGGDGTDPSLMFDRLSGNNGLRVGTSSNATAYQDQLLSSGTTSNLEINSPKSEINAMESTTLNVVNGLVINKSESVSTAQSWTTDNVASGAILRSGHTAVNYNGKAYIFGGQNGANVLQTMYSYEYATDIWRFVGNGTARTQHAAVVYGNKMYVWGGYNGVPVVVNTMDIYDFTTGTWSAGTAGGTARPEPSAVVYNDKMYIWGSSGTSFDVYTFATDSWSTLATTGGAAPQGTSITVYNNKIYMVGGDGASFTKIYSFDFRTNTWTALANSPVERAGHTIAIYDNKLYTFGGFTSTSTLLDTVSIYDFATDTWSSGVTGGTAKKYFYTTVYNGKAYNFFGTAALVLGTVDIYDFGIADNVLKLSAGDQDRIVLDQNNVLTISAQPLGLRYITNDSANYSNAGWSTGASGGSAREYHVSVEYNGKIYNWGGGTQALAALSNVMDIYDIKTNTWSTGTAGGTARWGAGGIVYNAKIYYFTGCTTTGGGCATVTNTVDVYDINANTWSTAAAGGTARSLGAIAQSNGKVYSWGGFTGAANLNTLDIYDIASNTWSTGTAGGTARRFTSGVIYKNKFYVYGGFVAAVSNILDIYDIQTNTWQAGTAGPTAKRSFGMVVYRDRIYILHGFTTVGVNVVDIYNAERGTWATGLSGGTADFAVGAVQSGNKAYVWAGGNSGSTAVINTLDILDFGSIKAEDIFYISGNLGTGQDEGKLFRFDSTGRAYTSKQGGWFSVGADYAEYMHTNDTSISSGDIVKLDPKDGKGILKAKTGEEFIGVISTNPGFVGNITSVEDINNGRSDMKLLSMVGQVPVKVTGDIATGDKITVSEYEGIGKKASEGEDTLGIAQESHSGLGIGSISVLITRNNEGINNKVELKLGQNGEAGFRLSSAGKLQTRDKDSEWKDIDKQLQISDSVIWEKIGDNIYANNTGITHIGEGFESSSTSKLQVEGDIEVKDGLKFLKISAANQNIILNSSGVGFRLYDNNLQFRDEQSGEWKGLDGLVLSNIRFNPDGSSYQVLDQEQVSGWGYVKGTGAGSTLNKVLLFGKVFGEVPIVIVDVTGSLDHEPENLSSCKYDSSIVTITPSSIDNAKFNLNVKTDGLTDTSKYYCYSWRALGN